MESPRPNGLVTLLTDFGTDDPYVGIVKGMIKRAFGRAEIVDLTHAVPPHDVAVGAFYLNAVIGRFPAGTVHLAVVDPGVGTERRCLAVSSLECYWVGPDNGILGSALDEGAEVRVVDFESQGLVPDSATFHGRDLFGPCAGRLAGGRYGFRALGPRIDDPVRTPALTTGQPRIVLVDRFGNLVTNVVPSAEVEALEIGGRSVPVRQAYGAANSGDVVAVANSYDLLEVAVVCGDASRTLGVGVGEPVVVVRGGANS